MQKLREESGLLVVKSEEKSAGKSRSDSVDSTTTSSTSASNKKGKISKKDKLKSKREAKRLRAVLAEQDSENAPHSGKEDSDARKKTPKNQKKLIYRMKDIEKCAAAMDILAISDCGEPVWNMKPTRFDFDHLENEEDRDLYVPDIHTIANTPTRICLSLPVPKGNQDKDKDKDKARMRAKSGNIDSNLSGDLDSRYMKVHDIDYLYITFFLSFIFSFLNFFKYLFQK